MLYIYDIWVMVNMVMYFEAVKKMTVQLEAIKEYRQYKVVPFQFHLQNLYDHSSLFTLDSLVSVLRDLRF